MSIRQGKRDLDLGLWIIWEACTYTRTRARGMPARRLRRAGAWLAGFGQPLDVARAA